MNTLDAEKPAPDLAARLLSVGYRTWFLIMMVVIYAINFLDRIIMSIVGQAVKRDLSLTDFELGLLTGLAFALFYTIVGIPFSRLAERFNRTRLLVGATVIWSAATALCGLASSFTQLLFYRLLVGVGQSGATPTAQSLISDQFAPEKRATALSVYAFGPPLGVFAASLGGGYVVQHYGWQNAFFIAGLPGLLIALIAWLTLTEPPRGLSDGGKFANKEDVPSLMAVLKRIWSIATFRQMFFGTVSGSIAANAINLFIPIFLFRALGMSFLEAGFYFGMMVGIGGIIGNYLGGAIADWLGKDRRWYAWVSAYGRLLAAPTAIAGLLMDNWMVSVFLLLIYSILGNTWNGPTFGTIHRLVAPRMRASSSAIVLLFMSLIGQGLGPAIVGLLSDVIASQSFAGGVFKQVCVGGANAPKAGTELAQACAAASANGLRYAMIALALVFLWSAVHYFISARSIERDLDAAS